MLWDEEAGDDTTNLGIRYYCTRCEQFFELSVLAPTRCPNCFADARYILTIPTREYDLDKLIEKKKEKYKGKLSR